MKSLDLTAPEVLNWIAEILLEEHENDWEGFLSSLKKNPNSVAEEIISHVTLGSNSNHDVAMHFKTLVCTDSLDKDTEVVASFLSGKFLATESDPPLTC